MIHGSPLSRVCGPGPPQHSHTSPRNQVLFPGTEAPCPPALRPSSLLSLGHFKSLATCTRLISPAIWVWVRGWVYISLLGSPSLAHSLQMPLLFLLKCKSKGSFDALCVDSSIWAGPGSPSGGTSYCRTAQSLFYIRCRDRSDYPALAGELGAGRQRGYWPSASVSHYIKGLPRIFSSSADIQSWEEPSLLIPGCPQDWMGSPKSLPSLLTRQNSNSKLCLHRQQRSVQPSGPGA